MNNRTLTRLGVGAIVGMFVSSALAAQVELKLQKAAPASGMPILVDALRKAPKTEVAIFCAPCDDRATKLADAFEEAGWKVTVEPAMQAKPGVLLTGGSSKAEMIPILNAIFNGTNSAVYWDSSDSKTWMIAIGPDIKGR